MNLFSEETFPYDLLEGYGLTREMIDDLPGHVLETIDNGGRSPLLPIEIPTKFGSVSAYTKFRISDTIMNNGKFGVIFYPQLSEAHLEVFNEEEKERLLSGKTILSDLDIPKAGNADEYYKEKCFVQIDKDTNHVFYVHTSVIGRNIKSIDDIIDLPDEDMEKLLSGELVTIKDPAFMTLGVDLFSETGLVVCPGDANNWQSLVGQQLDRYNFGLYGCWVNDDGKLHYVKEEDFDESIIKAQNAAQVREEKKQKAVRESFDETHQSREMKVGEGDNSQLTR